LIQAFAQKHQIDFKQVEHYIDLAAVSTCADLVPILDENRILVHFGLKKLKLYGKFNQPVDYLPLDIQELTFGSNFNQSVNNLPSKIQKLTFDWDFNQSVDNLPHNIKYLTFGYKFNQPIDNLPSGVEELTLGEGFNQSLGCNLPKWLKRLTISKNYTKTIIHIPVSVNIIRNFLY
jgi:hypothetical protein